MPTTTKSGEVVLTVGVDPELRHRVRLAAMGEKKSLKDAVTEALNDWLRRHEKKPRRSRSGSRAR